LMAEPTSPLEPKMSTFEFLFISEFFQLTLNQLQS